MGTIFPFKIFMRFERSKDNFERVYSNIVDLWVVFDTSGVEPVLVRSSLNHGK